MKKNIEKIDSKKEYEAPQMEVLDCSVQGVLCDSGDIIIDSDNSEG